MKALRLNHHQFAVFYGHLCDVITRDDLNISDEDIFSHTSQHARKVAMEVVERLANEGYLEYR